VTSPAKLAVARAAVASCPKLERVLVFDEGLDTTALDTTALDNTAVDDRVVSYGATLAAFPGTPVDDEACGASMLYSSGTTGRPKGIVRPLSGASLADKTATEATLEHFYAYDSSSIYLSPAPLYHAARPAWGLLVLLSGLYPGWLTLRRALFEPSLEASLLLTSGLVLNLAGAHDLGIANGAIPLEHDLAIAWAAVLCISLSAWIFVRRFIVALDTSEALSAELEQRVAHKHAELEANYVRLRALEEERAVAHERERMMAELHDGLGGQLVSTLAMLRSGEARPPEVESAVQAALDDMRLMIHSLEVGEEDLLSALATLRARLAPRLQQAGIRVDWTVEEVPTPPGFGPEKALQVMRIVQEAIANVLKHAGATELRVRTGVEERNGCAAAVLRIEDDGRGLGAPAPGGAGRGLANMRRRAERIGARLEVRSEGQGTAVRLELPL